MIVDELFNVTHDLRITPVGCRGHLGQDITALFVHYCGLGVENEWNGKETLSAISDMIPLLIAKGISRWDLAQYLDPFYLSSD